MTHDYLNPLELFHLTQTRAELITPDLLRSHKRRFLSELELEDKSSFTYHGREYTRNDLERAVTEAGTPEGLAAFLAAGKVTGLSAFFVSGQLTATVKITPAQLEVPALRSLLLIYLPPVYPLALREAVRKKDWPTAGELLSWEPTKFGLSPVLLYVALDEYMNRLVPDMLDIFKRYSCNIAHIYENDFKISKYRAKHWIRRMRLFSTFLPEPLTANFPAYLAPHLNELVARTIPYLKTMFKGAETRLAHKISEALLGLPHLETEKRELLKQMRRNNRVTGLDELLPSDMDSLPVYVGKFLIFMALILGSAFLYVECNPSEPAEPFGSVSSDPWLTYKNRDIRLTKEANLTGKYLRLSQLAGRPNNRLQSFRFKNLLPSLMINSLVRPEAGIRETNTALFYLGADTIIHVDGNILNREELILSLPLEEMRVIRLLAPEKGPVDLEWLDEKINSRKAIN